MAGRGPAWVRFSNTRAELLDMKEAMPVTSIGLFTSELEGGPFQKHVRDGRRA